MLITAATGMATSMPTTPQKCADTTTANITLSGEQTIDDIAVVSGDRVLVKAQTDTTQNGIYTASTGAWARAKDADSSVEMKDGTQVLVTDGTTFGQSVFFLETANPFVIGNDAPQVSGSIAADLDRVSGRSQRRVHDLAL